MYHVMIKNCNNIVDGTIEIEHGMLSIFYGINGTGKSTIAKAIEYKMEDAGKLSSLQSFYSDEAAEAFIEPRPNKISVFNEEFVNNLVFKEDEVIENSFEVFLKTPKYEEKKNALDLRLNNLHKITNQNENVKNYRKLEEVEDLIKYTSKSNKLTRTGAFKSVLSKENLYNVPESLECYRQFISNNDININWIDWKNKGDDFDIESCCPYCAQNYDDEEEKSRNERKEIFKKTYTKTNSQNLKNILGLIEKLHPYLSDGGFEKLVQCIKENKSENIIIDQFTKLRWEVDMILRRIRHIENLGNRDLAIADIDNLELQINEMEIPLKDIELLRGEESNSIYEDINKQVQELRNEAQSIRKELGELKGLVQATIRESQSDINEFLKTAGINYEIEIDAKDESNSRTILKQCFSEESSDVPEIREHLSWGEKNAFALVLFMYVANANNSDIIILDDPISSFDSNKKYAILHRLFKDSQKRRVSFRGKTVLLLTHDFEPITDFVVLGKLDNKIVKPVFLSNREGHITCETINPDTDVKLITSMCAEIARNSNVNIISRIVFLRKLCELNGKCGDWGFAYDVLSNLIHAQKKITRKDGHRNYIDLDQDDIEKGFSVIREYIHDFDYCNILNNTYKIDSIKALYESEKNDYFKLQLFRAATELMDKGNGKLRDIEDAWFKYIDETYHIENDLLHYLDITRFNLVPSYIIVEVDKLMTSIG